MDRYGFVDFEDDTDEVPAEWDRQPGDSVLIELFEWDRLNKREQDAQLFYAENDDSGCYFDRGGPWISKSDIVRAVRRAYRLGCLAGEYE